MITDSNARPRSVGVLGSTMATILSNLEVELLGKLVMPHFASHLLAEDTAHSAFGPIACSDFTSRSGQGTRQCLTRMFVLTDDPDAIIANGAEPVHVRAVSIRL